MGYTPEIGAAHFHFYGTHGMEGVAVQVSEHGDLTLTRDAFLALGSPRYVKVSVRKRRVWIKPAKTTSEDSRMVRGTEGSGKVYISARRVLKPLSRKICGRHCVVSGGTVLSFLVRAGF